MSKGLEALKDIYNSLINDIEQEEDEFYNPSDDIKYWEEKYNIVKQDLDRLEKLDEENKELKEELEQFKKPITFMCGSRESRLIQRMQLVSLAQQYNVPIILTDSETIQENKRLKNAIEILKNKLGLYVNDYINYATINAVLPVANNDCNRLTQQEYNLFKEVLYNE